MVQLVPNQWITDKLVITKRAGAEITLDGVAIAPDRYLKIGGGWEAARVTVDHGGHQFEGNQPFSVVLVGYDGADSYAYLSGSSAGGINPEPQG
ncbi:MAG: hypothetical protein HC927_02365 [Deltaproteobacteria bacterium]|nr:hypothetical protein [Deltaproteobacteria bacterium]